MSDEYTAPEVFTGDTVIWHDGRTVTDRGYAAIVTATGLNGVVDLTAFPVGAIGGLPRSGVRYHEDPDKRAINNTEDGVWSLTERAKRFATHEARVKTLPPAKPR
jgi:hypothetical protein